MYVRKVDQQVLTFQVSGKLWMRSLVMRDVETGSEWAHLLGRAMAGKLKGRELKPLISDMVTWAKWKKVHPDTTVLDMSRTSKDYSREFYRDRSKFVLGFRHDDQAWALPMEQLSRTPVHQFEINGTPFVATFDAQSAGCYLFRPHVGGRDLSFEEAGEGLMKDTQTGSLWNVATGEAVEGPLAGSRLPQQVGIMSYTRAWANFHPDFKDVPLGDQP